MNIAADIPTITGIIASVLTSTSMLPQLIKLIREKKAEDVSLMMMCLLITGLILWVVYGVLKKDYIIISANSFAAVVTILTAILSVLYKAK